ncbi:MAG TPA: toll/interleukin-1 receptor domain-containing protein, partial [Haloferula sp.]
MNEIRYRAFLSYATQDTADAVKLHRYLERYILPRELVGRPGRDGPIPRRLFPIFRDREELPLSSDIGRALKEALDASSVLVVLCSRNSAHSLWVNEEIKHFKSLGRSDRIIAVILDGRPNAPAEDREECLPAELRRASPDSLVAEPLWGNLQAQGAERRAVLLKLVAAIAGVGHDAIARRDQARRRRKQTVWAVISLLFVLAAIGWWDHVRVKSAYFTDLGEKWGEPIGLLPLDKAETRRRGISYRLESSRGKLVRIVRMNGYGYPKDDPDNHNASIRELSYEGATGELEWIIWKNHSGIVVMKELHGRLQEDKTRKIEFKQSNQSPMAVNGRTGALDTDIFASDKTTSRSEIAGQKAFYDSNGA